MAALFLSLQIQILFTIHLPIHYFVNFNTNNLFEKLDLQATATFHHFIRDLRCQHYRLYGHRGIWFFGCYIYDDHYRNNGRFPGSAASE